MDIFVVRFNFSLLTKRMPCHIEPFPQAGRVVISYAPGRTSQVPQMSWKPRATVLVPGPTKADPTSQWPAPH
jgi:hypothetical protein